MARLVIPPYKKRLVMMSLAETKNYGHLIHNVPEAWKVTKGEGIRVGVVDTGLPAHRDLEANIADAANFAGGEIIDVDGHSTHVCGIISALENNEGVVGIAPKAKLYIAKALNDQGSGDDDSISNAVRWCIEKDVHIINMSLGASKYYVSYFPKTTAAIKAAYESGIAVICAAGNEDGAVSYPAMLDETIAVAAVNSKEERAYFSNRGFEIDFAAAGVDVLSTYKNNLYAELSGTSMACPQVSGIAALILANHLGRESSTPINNVEDLRDHIVKMSVDLGEEGHDVEFGDGLPVFGHIDQPEPEPTPEPTPEPEPTKTWADLLLEWFYKLLGILK